MLEPSGTGEPRKLVNSVTTLSTDVSPDRRTVAYTDLSAPNDAFDRLSIANLSTGKSLTQRSIPKAQSEAYRLSPGGLGMTYSLHAHGADNIYREIPTGSSPTSLTRYPSGSISDFRCSSDGKRLAVVRARQLGDRCADPR